ncbi:unnamed protein product [Cyclocybe aegerita]|uniref:Uncharacterized protein n=1 Tax=Cyclocybe aegerita TaxID=1973307 RepID=A0A8S0XRY8_CYCAE|nr:unnamed protein product [Cyclocybe aegerita]
MTGFNIRNQSDVVGLQVFVSKYTNGSDEWYQVPNDFTSAGQYHWDRNGWEIVAFKDPATGVRRGWTLESSAAPKLRRLGEILVRIAFGGVVDLQIQRTNSKAVLIERTPVSKF